MGVGDFWIDDLIFGISRNKSILPEIKKVKYNAPATIVFWEDNTKTVVKCQKGDTYSKEMGLAMAIAKKAYGNKGRFNKIFKKWLDNES